MINSDFQNDSLYYFRFFFIETIAYIPECIGVHRLYDIRSLIVL